MKLSAKHIPLVLFSIFTIKAMILPISMVEVGALLVLGLVSAVYEYKGVDIEIEKLNGDIKKLETTVQSLSKSMDEVKTHISGVKLGQSMRNGNVR